MLSQSQHSNKFLRIHPKNHCYFILFLQGASNESQWQLCEKTKTEKTVLLATRSAKKQPAAMASLSSDYTALLSSNKELLLGSSQTCCTTASLGVTHTNFISQFFTASHPRSNQNCRLTKQNKKTPPPRFILALFFSWVKLNPAQNRPLATQCLKPQCHGTDTTDEWRGKHGRRQCVPESIPQHHHQWPGGRQKEPNLPLHRQVWRLTEACLKEDIKTAHGISGIWTPTQLHVNYRTLFFVCSNSWISKQQTDHSFKKIFS